MVVFTATLSNCGNPPKLVKIDLNVLLKYNLKMNTKECVNCHNNYELNDYLYKKDSRTGNIVNSIQCKTCFSEKVKTNKKKYYQNNKIKHAEYNSNPINKERRNKRIKERIKEEPEFRIIRSSKSRIHEILKGYKNCSSSLLLNCTRDELYKWIEFNFDNEINWNNYGNIWHIDHVIPIDFFDNTIGDQQNLCFHWSNLRPLKKEINMSKSNKIEKEYILTHYKSLEQFYKLNQRYQISIERCLWQRLELWYGNNPQDDIAFEEQLKRAIRSQVPIV